MKFGKHLNRVVGLSNPEWFPFWTNYKLLKKLINDIPAMVPNDSPNVQNGNAIRKNPYEVKFFKQLHAEVEKVSSFFAKTERELKIRFDRVQVGSKIVGQSDPKTMQDKNVVVGRSLYKLHKSLWWLETFAIVNYCAFSKILKKHDKRTGFETKLAFMNNVVNKSNFATYPDLLAMIRECEALYDQVSQRITCQEGQETKGDKKLSIDRVHKITLPEHCTKDDDALRKTTCCPPRVVTPRTTKKTKTNTKAPSVIESLLQDLLGTKRPRSASVLPIVSDISVIDRESDFRDVNTCSTQDSNDRKSHIAFTSRPLSKRQRCL